MPRIAAAPQTWCAMRNLKLPMAYDAAKKSFLRRETHNPLLNPDVLQQASPAGGRRFIR
jgi:hypothetical protein